jgi:DNA-binding MarR family transcriptional regulator
LSGGAIPPTVADRRRHKVVLTPKARKALERADRSLESVEDEVPGAPSHDERASVHRLLLRALDGAARPVETPARA